MTQTRLQQSHRQDYDERLNAVRIDGDWEGWIRFFLECVTEAADDAVATAQKLFILTSTDRTKIASHPNTTVATIRLLELLPSNPIITLPLTIKLLGVSKPTALRTIEFLQTTGILRETTGRRRDRVYAYHQYLQILTPDTQ